MFKSCVDRVDIDRNGIPDYEESGIVMSPDRYTYNRIDNTVTKQRTLVKEL